MTKMNNEEKKRLIARSKEAFKKEFSHISENDWDIFFGYINEEELLYAFTILLDARKEDIEVECSFENRFVDENDTHRFMIFGEERLPLNYDNVLAIIPNGEFKYLYEKEDITESFVSCIEMLRGDSYSGRFLFSGIIDEESANEGFADLNYTELVYMTSVYMIDEQSAIWKRYFAESYRLYESGQYKLAFLHSFIGFDSLIEYLNGILYDVYQKEQNEYLEGAFINYNRQYFTPLRLIEECVLDSQSYQRMKHLESENRGLIDDKLLTILRYVNDLENKVAERELTCFKFYEKLRNVLAHGDSYEREDIKEMRLYQKYYDVDENEMNFKSIYCDFFENIGQLIKKLVN